MADDVGQLLIIIQADISSLKAGLAEVKGELQQIKNEAQSANQQLANLSGTARQIQGSLAGGVRELASFFGLAFTVYGVLQLWKTAVEGWYSLLKAGVEAVDDYRMAVASASGLMTAISKVPEPELGAAYGAWKDYFEWLYRRSLETDRLVAAGGREVFEAGMELAMRGLVPKTEQQVYVSGMLVDMVKAVTKGLSEKQQLWQEIRSMFEGQVRLGAQALQKFTQIDPDFVNKFAAAREAMMKMGDAQPIWDLLETTLKGMSYYSQDVQNTMNSLVSTTKSGFQLLMIEAFGPAYEQIVKLGWELLNVLYEPGRLTGTGKLVAQELGRAWEEVRVKVEKFVSYLEENPHVVESFARKLIDGLTSAANAALSVAEALGTLTNTIASMDLTNVLLLAAALGGITSGNLIGMGIGLGAGTALVFRMMQQDAERLGTEIDKAKQKMAELGEEMEETQEKSSISMPEMESQITIEGPEMTRQQIEDVNKRYAAEYKSAYTDAWNTLEKVGKDAVDKGMDKWSAIIEYFYSQMSATFANKVQEKAGTAALEGMLDKMTPPTPDVKVQAPKAKKEGKGREEKDLELQFKLNEALLKEQLDGWKNYYRLVDEMDKTDAARRKAMLEMGQMDFQTYLDETLQAQMDSTARKLDILEKEKAALAETVKLNIENIKAREERGKITGDEAALMIAIEEVKKRTAIYKLDVETSKVRQDGAQAAVQLAMEEYKWREKIRKEALFAKLEAEAQAFGSPLLQKELERRQAAETFRKESMGYQVGSPEWQNLYDAYQLKLKGIEFGEQVKGLTNAITNALDGLIDGIMEGKVDIRKIGTKLFKDILKEALKPGMDMLKDQLTNLFKQMFESLGTAAASAMLAAIAILGLMFMKQGGGSFSPSGVQGGVTGHEAVRGVIAGETSIPIAEIGVSLSEALVETNGILEQIEANTRATGGIGGNLNINLSGIEEAVQAALETYFSKYLVVGS